MTHTYRVGCRWTGSTAEGYERYSRTHTVTTGSRRVRLSSDPAFRGDPKLLNPEQLLVAAAVSCQLLSFLAVAARARLDVRRYSDDAEAEMPERPRGMRIERIQLRPDILLGAEPRGGEDKVKRLIAQAHRECFIANSLACEMTITPRIRFGGKG